MNNFTYYNPVRTLLGENQIKKLPSLIAKDKKVLIVYGQGSIVKNGILDSVKKALNGHCLFEFAGVSPNPQYDHLIKSFDIIKKEKIDFLLAIGGGSVIDATKFISIGAFHKDDPWKILAENQKIESNIEFGCILTLPATGSEGNPYSVISRGEDKLSFGGDERLFSKFAILDPTYTYTLPPKQLANGITDAFVHVLEQYLTVHNEADIQDMYALSVLTTLQSIAPKVLKEKEYHSRANFMWAANQALSGILGVGQIQDWATHCIGHELTALYGIDHARSLAIVLPALLKVQLENKKDKIIEFGLALFSDDDPLSIINKTKEFFESLEVPTDLKSYGINKSDIPMIAKKVAARFPTPIGEKQDIDENKIIKILEEAYS